MIYIYNSHIKNTNGGDRTTTNWLLSSSPTIFSFVVYTWRSSPSVTLTFRPKTPRRIDPVASGPPTPSPQPSLSPSPFMTMLMLTITMDFKLKDSEEAVCAILVGVDGVVVNGGGEEEEEARGERGWRRTWRTRAWKGGEGSDGKWRTIQLSWLGQTISSGQNWWFSNPHKLVRVAKPPYLTIRSNLATLRNGITMGEVAWR